MLEIILTAPPHSLQVSMLKDAVPIRWTDGQESPVLRETGSWEEVAEKAAARQQGNVYRKYTVTRVEPESSTITSFYLQPESGGQIPCHLPGQFLPIEIEPTPVSVPCSEPTPYPVHPTAGNTGCPLSANLRPFRICRRDCHPVISMTM